MQNIMPSCNVTGISTYSTNNTLQLGTSAKGNTGNAVGSVQQGQMQTHNHSLNYAFTPIVSGGGKAASVAIGNQGANGNYVADGDRAN